MKNQLTSNNRISLAGGIAAAIVAVTLLASAPPAASQVIYATGFEPPTFVEDTTLVGQDGWIAPPPFSPNAAIVSRDKPRIGRQSVHVLGADLEHQDFINEVTGGYYDAIGSYRRAVDYDTEGTKTIHVSTMVRIDGPRTANGNNFFSAAVSTRAETTEGTASVGEIALSSDGHVYVYSGNEGVPTFLAETRVRLGQWHQLSVVADFRAKTTSFCVNGRCLGTFPFDPAENYTGLFLRGTLLAYTAPDTDANQKADYAAHFDQFSIKVVADRNCDHDDD